MNKFFLFIFLFPLVVCSQTISKELAIQIEATIQTSPLEITLNWINDGTSNGYSVYKRNNTSSSWGSAISNLGALADSYIDNTINISSEYEYKIIKTGNSSAYGYINVAIELPEISNRGILILVVENTFIGNTNFDNAIDQTIEDIKNDGWFVERIDVNRNDDVSTIKTQIKNIYNQNTSITKAVYIIGHVPVAYSGVLNPDGHSDHLGAWSSDSYYADMNGNWTDVSANNTSAAQTRNHNIPGDGKFDQFTVGACELQIGRVDFSNMTTFSLSEEELLIKYLNKAHSYKTKQFTAVERALIVDNFTTYPEGFASSGYRNFSTMFSASNISNVANFRSTLNNNSYMWSFACGAGSFSSCFNVGSTSNFASDSLQTIFSMLFGSYFGDWDSDNNLLRAIIAQGQTLNSVWAGRPHWQVHHMALGQNIGFGEKLTQNNSSSYFVSNLTSQFARMITISLMGDPTTRMHYITPPSNLLVINNNNTADLSWLASPDSILGYNIYRIDGSVYTKVNSNLVTGTVFSDNSILNGGIITYVVKAVNLKTSASGSYYNQSLGIRDNASFTVNSLEMSINKIKLYPNPANDNLFINGENIKRYSLFSIDGKIISLGNVNNN